MKCIIVDDNPLAALSLKQLASQVETLAVIGDFTNALEAYDFLNNNNVDLVFLDIEMPGMTGLELAKSLNKKPIIIFTSSQLKYAAEAFELAVADYLIKPFTLQRFLQSVSKAREILKRENTELSSIEADFLFIKENKLIKKIDCNDILWIEAMGDYVKINVQSKWYIVHATLKQLEDRLDPIKFMRVHRSYIVSLFKIDTVEENTILIGENSIPVAETYKAKFLSKIKLL
jgi:DNA-binding LytR/AlgR family response regulator